MRAPMNASPVKASRDSRAGRAKTPWGRMMGIRLACAVMAMTLVSAGPPPHERAGDGGLLVMLTGSASAQTATVDIRGLLQRAARDPARVLKLLEDDRSFPGGRRHYEAKIEGLVDVLLAPASAKRDMAVAAQILGSLEHPWETRRPDIAARRLSELAETGPIEARADFARALANRSGLYTDASGQNLSDPEGYGRAMAGYAAMRRFDRTPHALVSSLRLALMLAGCKHTPACDPEIAAHAADLADTAHQAPGEQALAMLRALAPLDPASKAFRASTSHWRWRNDAAFTLGLAEFYNGDFAGARETFSVLRDWPRQSERYADDLDETALRQLRRTAPDYRDQVFVWSVLPGRALPHNRHFAAETVGRQLLLALENAQAAEGGPATPVDAFVDTFDAIENTDNTIIFGSFRTRAQAQNFMDSYQPLLESSRRGFNGSLPELELEVGAPASGSSWFSVRTRDTLSDRDVHAVLEALRDTPAFQKVQPYTDRPRVQ